MFIALVFSFVLFLLVSDTALVMCIIFRSLQWCWRYRCPKNKKITTFINQSVIPQSTNGESTKKWLFFFLTSASKKLLLTFSLFVGFTSSSLKVTSLCWISPLPRWRGAVSLKGNSVRCDISHTDSFWRRLEKLLQGVERVRASCSFFRQMTFVSESLSKSKHTQSISTCNLFDCPTSASERL